ncbi:MAG: hypothetical protein HYW28_14620 [Rhodospirillales bacterium]|nr:hypothetical protein [Rhodospirillales bacterium]
MTTERTRPAAGGPRQKGGRGSVNAGGDKVAVTVRISRDTFELLQNIALGHEFAKVATASRGGQVAPRDRTQSVAAVIEHLIERHRDSLEAEDRLSPGRRGKDAGPGSQKGR